MMMLQVNGGLYGRYGKAVTNFNQTLPAIQSDLAQAAFKDPYHFGFLDVAGKKMNWTLSDSSRKNIKAEYALRGMTQPLGIAEYDMEKFYDQVKASLPSIEELENSIEDL